MPYMLKMFLDINHWEEGGGGGLDRLPGIANSCSRLYVSRLYVKRFQLPGGRPNPGRDFLKSLKFGRIAEKNLFRRLRQIRVMITYGDE